MDQTDEVDIYGTFTPAEARRIGVILLEEDAVITENTFSTKVPKTRQLGKEETTSEVIQ
jgi:hypothetical protein